MNLLRKLFRSWRPPDPWDVPCRTCQEGYWSGSPAPHICQSSRYCPCPNTKYHLTG